MNDPILEDPMPRGRRSANPTPAPAAAAGAPKRGRRRRTDGRLADLVSRYVNDLVAAVRQEVRRSVADEVSDILTGRRSAGGLSAGRTRRGANGRKRIVQCIKPGCTNPSKGPRFHYLCEEHKDAKKSDYEAWRKARKEKQAA